jgi:2-keto-myo-inositol isomerase
MQLALNHMVSPQLDHAAFFQLAQTLGIDQVEIRNDLHGVAILDGTPAVAVGSAAAQRGLKILTINALQRFNDWNDSRGREAEQLARYARESGAKALVLCPVNDETYRPAQAARLAGLRTALKELEPILSEAGIEGFVEPLGFPECSLRLKAEAVDAIDAVGGGSLYRLVHDTFHHHVAGESQMFPERTGIVHSSGVTDTAATATNMRDPHRVLVDESDRLGNVAQIRALLAAGYRGPVSFEPFAAQVHQSRNISVDLRRSLDYLRSAVEC